MATFSLAARNAALDAHNAKMMVRIARETDTAPQRPIRGATAGGDERKLRGIPAIGRGVAGAIAGTCPHNVR